MKKIDRLITHEQDMRAFAREIAQSHRVVLLSGDLGAGKTMFAKGFAEGLGIDAQQVQSPTYTYLHVYDNQLLHMDFYRLESFEHIIQKGILDQMAQYPYILIEWPKWIGQLELDHFLHLQIEKISDTERQITEVPK